MYWAYDFSEYITEKHWHSSLCALTGACSPVFV